MGARLQPGNGASTVSERDGWVCGLRWATRLASLVTHWAVTLGETVGGLGVLFRPFSLSLRRRSALRHDALEVQLDFAVHHAPHPFDETARFVIFLSDPDDVVELHARRDGERGLEDDLIARIEFRARRSGRWLRR